jgi:hypothetical protein
MRWNVFFDKNGKPSVNFTYYQSDLNMSSPHYTYSVTFVGAYSDANYIDFANFFASSTVGYPQSFTQSASRTTILQLFGTHAGTDMMISFKLTDNFQEVYHEFFRPSALKVDVEIDQGAGFRPTSLLIQINTMPGKGKLSSFSPTAYGARYDPMEQDRVVLGQIPDQELLQRGYVSVGKSMVKDNVCFQSEEWCTYTSLLETQSNRATVKIENSRSTLDTIARYQLNMGFFDPSETPPKALGTASSVAGLGPHWLLLIAAVQFALWTAI